MHARRLYQEIWQHGTLYSYAVDDFDIAQTLKGPLQDGWGITTDGKSLILSDGSADLSFVDPDTLAVTRTLPVMPLWFLSCASTQCYARWSRPAVHADWLGKCHK